MEKQPARRKEWFTYARNELQMYYQPKIALADGRIVGAEALLRIRTSDETAAAPIGFLEEMERKGEGSALDWFVFCEVCRHIRYMLDCKLEIPVSVNFARSSIKVPRFVQMLTAAADRCTVPHGLLEIEVTEGILEENPTAMRQILHELMSEGFGVAIDDFGKGYSSLGFIKDVNFTTLKIDMEFLRDFDKAESKAVIDCVIALGKRLNKRIVSEGVETREQAAYLFDRGCDAVQGFFFARPMPLDPFIKFVKGYAKRNIARTLELITHTKAMPASKES